MDEKESREDAYLQLMELGASQNNAELSLDARIGAPKPTTMRLVAWIRKQEMILLVDSESSHNFVNSLALKKVGIQDEEVELFEVRMSNGENLHCLEVVHGVIMNV